MAASMISIPTPLPDRKLRIVPLPQPAGAEALEEGKAA
jgi:hypothetical protein